MFRIKQEVILINYKKAVIVAKVKDKEQWIAEYYDDDNKLQKVYVTKDDVLDEKRYNSIRKRLNNINRILKNM